MIAILTNAVTLLKYSKFASMIMYVTFKKKVQGGISIYKEWPFDDHFMTSDDHLNDRPMTV